VAAVYPEYKEDLKGIGSRLNEPKNAVLLGPECELPEEFPIRRGAIYDGPMGKSGNLVGYGIVCVGVPIGDAPFIHRYLELKEGGVFEKFDRTMELLGPTSKFTAFRLTQQCLAPQVDFLGRTLDPSASTAGFFARFDRKVEDTFGKHFYRSDQPKTADGRPPVGLTGTGPRVVQAEPAKAEPDAETVPLLARWVVLPSAYHPAL
jgi:hypothetical protein